MVNDTTLFAQVLPMFTSQTERVATEALRHILEQSESARNALEIMMVNAGVEVGSLTRFQTEAIGDEGERVDLVCYDEHGTERVLIEAKFWAGLTDNQPNTYLARLPQDTHSALVFVAPGQRMETLWPMLCRRAQDGRELTMLSETGDLRSAAIDDGEHKMLMTSWRALLGLMMTQASGYPSVVADVQQLSGLSERMDSEAFLPWRADELGPEFARRMLQLPGLIDAATARARTLGWLSTTGFQATSLHTGYGRYMRLAGMSARFDVNFEHWAKRGDTPLWLWLYNINDLDENETLSRLRALEKSGAILGNEWYIPINLTTGAEYDEVLNCVVEQLVRVGHLIDPNGPTYK